MLAGGEVVAKCGKHVVWHWSHLTRQACDPWWENETEWHRQWKDRFSKDWQEVIQNDATTGERHIADVRTKHDVVVEFQHSTIDPLEVDARESFYQRIVWVVDGAKSKSDCINFLNVRSHPDENGFSFFRWYGRSKLFKRWHTNKLVFIDFGDKYGFWRVCRFDPKTKEGVALLVDRSLFTISPKNVGFQPKWRTSVNL